MLLSSYFSFSGQVGACNINSFIFLSQLSCRRWVVGGDGVFGRWFSNWCGNRDLHGWGTDCCSVQRGNTQYTQITLLIYRLQPLNYCEDLILLCIYLYSVYRLWTSSILIRWFIEISRVTTFCWAWMVLWNSVSYAEKKKPYFITFLGVFTLIVQFAWSGPKKTLSPGSLGIHIGVLTPNLKA